MSIPEQMAVLAGGKSVDMARPSHEQRNVMERLAAILRSTNRDLLQRRRQRQYTRPNTDPPPHAQPADPWTYQHGRQTRSTRYSPLGEDLLAAMQGCSALGTSILLVKYAQDRSSENKAINALCEWALDLATEKGWRTHPSDKGKDIIRSMCRLAVFEAQDPRCRKCGGGGYTAKGNKCTSCKGGGALRIHDTERARAIGVTQPAYHRRHKGHYEIILSALRSAEDMTVRRMRRNIG